LTPWHRRYRTAAENIRDEEKRMAPGESPLTFLVDSQAVVERHVSISAHQTWSQIWPNLNTSPRNAFWRLFYFVLPEDL